MTTVQDDRLRAMMSRLEEMTPPAPEFEALRRSRDRLGHRPGARTIIALAAALAVVVAGLMAIGARDHDVEPTSRRPLTTHALPTTVPAGWEAKGAVDAAPDAGYAPFREIQLFATATAPTGPVLGLLYAGAGTYADGSSQSNVQLSDGRRAAIGSTHFADARSLDVEVAPGRWIGLVARNISDPELLQIGTLVEADAAGNPSIVGQLPDGLTPGGSTSMFNGIVTASSGSDANELPAGSTVTSYGPLGGDAELTISSGPIDVSDSAMLAITGVVTPLTDVGGSSETPTFAVDFGEHGGVGVYRISDGLAFLARSATLDTAQVLSVVDSLDVSDEGTWKSLVDRHRADEASPTQNTTTDTTQVPPPVTPGGEQAPTNLVVDYDIVPTNDGYRATATVQGDVITLDFRFVGRTVLIDPTIDGASVGSAAGSVSLESPSSGQYMSAQDPAGASFYASLVADDSESAEMRVTVGSVVYSTQYVTIDPTYPVKIAMIVVPPRVGRTDRPSGYTYDADGNPLDSL